MKVAIIIERFDIALGGAERSIYELANGLRSCGVEVDILAAKGTTEADNLFLLCKDVPTKRVRLSTFAQAIQNHLSEKKYDIVHSTLPFDFADVYQPRGGSYPEAIKQNAASYENSLIVKYKELTSFTNRRRTEFAKAEKFICRKNGKVIVAALSQYVKQQFKKYYDLCDDRIAVICNGINTDGIASAANENKNGSYATFLFAANNFRLKGLGNLIRAVAKAKELNPKKMPHTIIAGGGNENKYRKLAKSSGVDGYFDFIGKVKNIKSIIADVNAAVLPTYYDPSSRFVLEALAAGVPVITTKLNGACDLFENGRHGKVIDSPADIDGLTEAIVYFCDKQNENVCRQAIQQDNIREKVSIKRHCKELISLYESI